MVNKSFHAARLRGHFYGLPIVRFKQRFNKICD